jgi:hypothetical protein
MAPTLENNASTKDMTIPHSTHLMESLTTQGSSATEISSLQANAVIDNTDRLNS